MIAIIKYNAGNIRSVQNALTRLGYESIITDNPEEIQLADKVIFPGVGEASSAMQYLKERNLDELIVSLKQPVLGICLGLQLMCTYSEEGNTECLGIFDACTKQFPPKEKVPHMGWNNFFELKSSKLFKNIALEDDVYYVHGYYAEVSKNTLAICDYILPFSTVMQQDNFYAMQFHPEKSADVGEQLLKNFLEL
ncbi:imidazole glycerol phosphate synthase subunit HisH [Tenacibaculum mesophilum]|uniref:Imidazole glycerol phosphate synthase subunit HisH n=1 Tax=Tenacibaculum mesophilum TaxID=104268 RepID=A0AAE9SEJ5_9FLAO|nr:imidazole glycerol phosphate synthase subunit HisH [Tenacibaculum mesophilum]GFD82837.1 imidazole glycerol phosphate synthase subunit HisH [Tenacibaculum sp. KUL118]GFD93090.1 imidazole glycerol phosphate synthase subunit HisH [Alteromonas sp. KUL154]GFE01343.1 imidazole glycerol phosphate synthase subunit HisH [Alteromonas sp. KUL156]UTD14442.1 imidazole glycerol phosphate synthase subunit HisH [Tenacibaculum mesophilum]BFF37570.1 imidazole glycerol phosphate synthase subunit HisH [Tenacib